MSDEFNPASVIPAVSESLRNFICDYVPLLSEGTVTFDSPADWEGTKQNGLSIYLYQIEIDPYLRNSPSRIIWKQAISDHPFSLTSVPAPLAFDLTYMMVAYGSSGENEQMIANGLVNLLDTCGYIPDEYLARALKLSGNDSLAVVPEFTSIHELRDLWSAFSQKGYHLTKLYTVPAVRIPSSIETPVDMVVQTTVSAQLLNGEIGNEGQQ